MNIAAFLLFEVVGRISPGPNNIMLLASGKNHGFSKTVPHILGIAVGYASILLVLALGFGHIFDTFPALYEILKYIGGGYLFFLAYKIARSTKKKSNNQNQQVEPLSFLQALLFQWVNPKSWTIGLIVFSTYIQKNNGFYLQVVTILVISIVVAIIGSVIWTLFGVKLKTFLADTQRSKVFNYMMAILLVVSYFLSFL